METISYNEIKKMNGGSRWKTDKIIDYYEAKGSLEKVNSMPDNKDYILYYIKIEDLKYKSIDFEPPIGLREWIAWGLLLASIIANVIIAIISNWKVACDALIVLNHLPIVPFKFSSLHIQVSKEFVSCGFVLG